MALSRRDRFESAAVVHLDELFRVARRVMGDASAAEDVVQEAYLRAWQAFDRFEPGTNCRAWLHRGRRMLRAALAPRPALLKTRAEGSSS